MTLWEDREPEERDDGEHTECAQTHTPSWTAIIADEEHESQQRLSLSQSDCETVSALSFSTLSLLSPLSL